LEAINAYTFFRLFMSLSGVVILFALFYGRYWAWIAIQIIMGLNVLFFIMRFLSGDLHPQGKPISPIVCIIYFCLAASVFWYLYFKKVRLFCSVGHR